MNIEDIKEGLTFDDVLLVPAYSEILPSDTDTSTKFSRNINLNTSFVLIGNGYSD
jgi:IMP dehydrogenase